MDLSFIGMNPVELRDLGFFGMNPLELGDFEFFWDESLTSPKCSQVPPSLGRATVAELRSQRLKILLSRFDLLDVTWKKKMENPQI